MQKYSEFRPTQFDPKGLGAEHHGIADFLVVPVSHTRDSEPLDESNFAVAVKMLGGESDDVQIHRFGHWGPGWFEIILVNPACADKVEIAESIESRLLDYPVLDDDDHSQREDEACCEVWTHCYNEKERMQYFREHSYTATSLSELYQAIRQGSWYHAANCLHCPSDLLY